MNQNQVRLILITGGVRSGKSTFAEKLAAKLGKKVAFIATAQALDEEMEQRIAHHLQNRPSHWETFEEPYQVSEVIRKVGQETEVILVDCLTLLISNLMREYQEGSSNQKLDDTITQRINEIIELSCQSKAVVIVVTNEVGFGLVPANPMGRFFRDILGKANQLIAAKSDCVYLMVAGIPISIKGHNHV